MEQAVWNQVMLTGSEQPDGRLIRLILGSYIPTWSM